MRKYVRILILALCAVMTTSCEKHNLDAETLRIYLPGDPTSLNPHVGVDRRCRMMQGALLEGLTRIRSGGEIQLALAESLEISEDQKNYLFHLRPTFWNNGEALTALDFERTWKQAIASGSKCQRAELFYLIKNGEKIKKGELDVDAFGVKALDEHTLKVTLEHVAPYFLEIVSNPNFFPIYSQEGPFVGNGPFALANWAPGKLIELKQNKSYWDAENVQIKKIDIALVADENTVFLMFEKGELDWAGRPFRDLPEEALPKLSQEGRLQSRSVNEVFWLGLNTEKVPLNSSKVRQALSVAIDREELAEHVMGGNVPTRTLMKESESIMGQEKLYSDANPKLARKLFDEGLSELGLTRKTLPPLKVSHSSQLLQKKMAQALAEKWKKTFDIEVALEGNEWTTHFSKLNNQEYQIGGYWWWKLHNDPICSLEWFKSKTCGYNITRWEDAEYIKLLDLANQESDPSKRLEYIGLAEAYILDQMPVIPLVSHLLKYVKTDRVKGVVITPTGHIDFKWAYLN